MELVYNKNQHPYYLIWEKRRSLTIRLQNNQIVVKAPRFASNKIIEQFVEKHYLKMLNKLKNNEFFNVSKEEKFFYIWQKKISFDLTSENIKSYIFTNNKLIFNEKNFFLQLNKYYIDCLTCKIQNFLQLKMQNAFCLNNWKFTFKNFKSKWGHCNLSKKEICLNLKLIHLNEKFFEYVLIHELCHINFPHHKSSFWKEVEKYCSNFKSIKKELNMFNLHSV